MLLKEKFFIVAVIAAVVAGFLVNHALHCLMETFEGGCGFGLAALAATLLHTGAAQCPLWYS